MIGTSVFRWTAATGVVNLGSPGANGFVFGLSGDGTTIVGRGDNLAFRWTASAGFVSLGDLPGGATASSSLGVNDDGTVVVGNGQSASGVEAFRWTSATGMVGLGDLPGGSFRSLANASNSDGTVIAGRSSDTNSGPASRAVDSGPPNDVNLQLFLLVGQSNMAGRGTIEAEDRQPIQRVWKLDQHDQWAPATDPLHFDKKNAGVGIGRSFAKAITDARPDARVGLVPCAVGGTSIDQWKKGGKLYTEAVRRAKIAMKHGKFAGILWHQGESDSGSAEKLAAYPAKLETLIADLRKDLDCSDAPFVLGELGKFHVEKTPGTKGMNELLLAFPKTHPNTACASSEGLTDLGDHTHFDAKSSREFGRRYAKAFLSLADKK